MRGQSGGMSWFTLSGQELIEKGSDAWSIVRDRSPVVHPVLHGKFLGAALQLLPCKPQNLYLACTNSDGRAASCALLLRKCGFGVWETVSIPQLPISLICSNGAADATNAHFIKALFNALPGPAWAIKMMRYDGDYSPRLHVSIDDHVEKIPSHTTVRVDVIGTFDEYWAGRSKNLRRNIRGILNRLTTEGLEPRLVTITEPAETAAAVVSHGSLEATGWKGDAGTHLTDECIETRFYQQVLNDFALQGKARIYQLYLGDTLAASQITLIDGGIQTLLKTAYRGDFSRFAPGRVLDYFMLQRTFAEGAVQRVEYCTKASEDDLRWATAHRPIYQVNVFRAPVFCRTTTGARRLKRMLTTRPAQWALATYKAAAGRARFWGWGLWGAQLAFAGI